MSVISKTISNSSTSTNEHPLWSSQSHSRLNSFSTDKDAGASLIFERNVEDPNFLSQSSRPVSRPVSRAMSRSVSRNISRPLSRQPSQATISMNQNSTNNVTNYTSVNVIHKPMPTKRNSSFSFSTQSNDLRRYNTNPNNGNNGNNTNFSSSTNINNVTSSQIRRVKTGNPQLYSQTYNTSSNINNCNCNNANNVNNSTNDSNYLHTLENFVPPALDESCSIVTDANTKLDDVDMIYSKRPSTFGLDMALGRTRSSSTVTPRAQSTHDLRLNSTNLSSRQTSNELKSSPSPSSRLLRFYSYVDMLSDENLQQQQAQAQAQAQAQSQQQRPEFLPHYSYSNDNTIDSFRKKPEDNKMSISTIQNSDNSTSGSSSSFFINPFMRNKKNEQHSKKHQLKNKPSGTLKSLRSKFHLHSESSSSQDEEEDDDDDNEEPNSNREKSPKSIERISVKQDMLYPDNNDVATIKSGSSNNNNNNDMTTDNQFVSDFNYDDLNDDDRLQKEKVSDILRRRVTEQSIPFNNNNNNGQQGHGYLDDGSDPMTK